MILFCQVDVTGRTEDDPAAAQLVRNILARALEGSRAQSPRRRTALYVGDAAGRRHLESSGVQVGRYAGGRPGSGQVLIVGSGAREMLAENAPSIRDFLSAGGHVLALGLNEAEAESFLPFDVGMQEAEYIASHFEPPRPDSPFAGVCPADVHNRDPKRIPLIRSGVEVVGNGALAHGGNVIFCQFPPHAFAAADGDQPMTMNVKRTYRRSAFLLTRLLGNLGVRANTPLLSRFSTPVAESTTERGRWLHGLYLDQPDEWDDPYRFFRW